MKFTLTILLFFLLSIELLAQKPIMLDDIHYYVGDSATRKTANDFFKLAFKAKTMADNPMNPLAFIDFLQLRPDQSTINISSPGPFPGIKVGDPKRWLREKIEPSPKNPPVYGVQWLAINTTNLKKTIKDFQKMGAVFVETPFQLPLEPTANVAAMWGFDYNLIVLVERKELVAKTPYGIDHLQLIVRNLDENIKFYQEVVGAEVIQKKGRSAELMIGKHTFILSEPEALGFDRSEVQNRDPKKFIPNIDHLGFLYENKDALETHYYNLLNEGYKFVMEPRVMNYYEKPTPYTFCIMMSPDGLQIELEIEEGRTAARTKVLSKK